MDLYRYYIHNKSINLKCDLKQFAKELNSSKVCAVVLRLICLWSRFGLIGVFFFHDQQSQRHNYNNNVCGEREEIRRKLAMVSSSSSSSSSNDPTITVQLGGGGGGNKAHEHALDHHLVTMPDYLRTSRRSKPPYMGQNLQICFMNESINDDSTENGGDDFRLEHFSDKMNHSNSHGSLDSDPEEEEDHLDDDDQLEELNLARAHNKSDNSNASLSVTIPAFSFNSSSATSSREDVLLKLQVSRDLNRIGLFTERDGS